jgi:hypothetical protein
MRAIRTAFKLLGGLVAAAAVALGARTADAQVQVLDLPTPSLAPPPFTGEIEEVGKRAFWRAGRTRWFFAGSLEAGNIYLRGSAAVGYGKPHWFWGGIEGSSAAAPNGGVVYGGLRFAAPYVDLRAGARYTFTMSQHYLAVRDTYERDELEHTLGPKMRHVTLEAEIASGYPLFGGGVFGIFGIYHPVGLPEGWNMFDPTLQIVAAPPLLWRARLGYLKSVDKWDMFRLGGAVEAVGNPPRGLVVVRAGPTITALITHHLEAYGAALLVIHSPDKLGIASGQLGEVGFRYRFASGDRWPELP